MGLGGNSNWRRGRDLNPRYSSPYTRLAVGSKASTPLWKFRNMQLCLLVIRTQAYSQASRTNFESMYAGMFGPYRIRSFRTGGCGPDAPGPAFDCLSMASINRLAHGDAAHTLSGEIRSMILKECFPFS